MRILWIEDFGMIEPDRLLGGLTGWLNDEAIDDLAKEIKDRIGVGNTTNFFAGWRRFYQGSSAFTALGHEVDFCLSFSEVETLLDSDKTCDHYDAVLIDIDLSENDFFNVIPDGIDSERAGIWIYNRLVHAGFPPERLAFFTGNDDKAGAFVAACNEFYIHPKPKSFGKIQSFDNKVESLSTWLTMLEHAADNYIMLRRGVMDGCKFLEEILIDSGASNESGTIQFNRYIAGNSDAKMCTEEAREYLSAVSAALPARQPSKGSQARVYRLFLRTLAHEWEDKANPNNLRLPDQLLSTLGWTMKNTRNWLSHSRVMDRARSKELAFLFLVNMRAMFVLGKQLEAYEMQLLRLFGAIAHALQDDEVTADLNLSYVDARNRLVQINGNPESTQNDRKGEDVKLKHYSQVANAISRAPNPPTDFDFLKSLYRIFWHGLSTTRFDRTKTSNELPSQCGIVLYTPYVQPFKISRYPAWVKDVANAVYIHSFSDLNRITT